MRYGPFFTLNKASHTFTSGNMSLSSGGGGGEKDFN
uniref:Uncharacterized protein n=1 Tax=Amphimedon queenslandica TaxID=400682 RepID=A0A1X7VVE7_AMPQE